MTYRAILAPASARDEDAAVFDLAAEVAARHQAELRILSAFPTPAVQLSYVSPPGFYIDPVLVRDVQASNDEARALIRSRAAASAARAGLAMERRVRVIEDDLALPEALAPWLPLTDLMVVGAEAGTSDFVAHALLHAGPPVLVARAPLALDALTIAIGWDGGLNAGRAVRAALPLLAEARRIVALQQPDSLSTARRRCADPARFTDYMRLHGCAVEFQRIDGGDDTGEAILKAARGCDAGLLVCGAFGHSRLAELVLGGVTRKVLAAGGPSVLLAH
ncbi:MAG TPA: universal stress protein [Caulobacteraceae bacterium]|nr:universal stress protein [Caulobacteraceae bacterium]